MPFDSVTYGAAKTEYTAQDAAQASQLAAIPNTGVGGSLTLTVLGWSANVQTKAAAGVTATNYVTVSPASGYEAAYLAAGITVAQTADTLTFTCTSTPAVPINVIYIVPSTSFNSVRYYTNVAGMVADTTLKVGDVCQTKGYYTANDGGDGLYNIVAAATGTANGGTFIDLSGISGQAKLVVGETINIKQFGAYGDDSHDDTAAITAAITAGGGNRAVVVPYGTFRHTGLSLPTYGQRLRGINKFSSVLKCTQAAANGITVNYEMTTVEGLTVRGNGTNAYGANATNGDGILINGVEHKGQDILIRDCIIEYNGGNGIRFMGGCWIDAIQNNIIWKNKLDGVNISHYDGPGQKNKIDVMYNNINANGRNGVYVWGTIINIKGNTIEGNLAGAAVSIDGTENANWPLADRSAYSINIDDNYIEDNGKGTLIIHGGRYGSPGSYVYCIVTNIRFSGNYVYQTDGHFASLPCADFTIISDAEERIYGLHMFDNAMNDSECTTVFDGNGVLNSDSELDFRGFFGGFLNAKVINRGTAIVTLT